MSLKNAIAAARYDKLVAERKAAYAALVFRGPAIPEQRKRELIEATRQRFLEKGREFFCVNFRCPDCKERAKRRTIDGSCTKCQK